jgi:hypothetical protein
VYEARQAGIRVQLHDSQEGVRDDTRLLGSHSEHRDPKSVDEECY